MGEESNIAIGWKAEPEPHSAFFIYNNAEFYLKLELPWLSLQQASTTCDLWAACSTLGLIVWPVNFGNIYFLLESNVPLRLTTKWKTLKTNTSYMTPEYDRHVAKKEMQYLLLSFHGD
jgi:hypothetical protein